MTHHFPDKTIDESLDDTSTSPAIPDQTIPFARPKDP